MKKFTKTRAFSLANGNILNLLAGTLKILIKVLGNYFQVSIVWEAFIQLLEFLTEIDPCECKLTSYCLIFIEWTGLGTISLPFFHNQQPKVKRKFHPNLCINCRSVLLKEEYRSIFQTCPQARKSRSQILCLALILCGKRFCGKRFQC